MPLFRLLFVLFLVIPVIEIYLLIEVGSWIGPWPTIFLVIGTAVLGAGLLRIQGLSTMLRVREKLARGEIPAVPMLEGVFLLIAGALLLTPGFFTDGVGFLLLVPSLRQALSRTLLFKGVFGQANFRYGSGPASRSQQQGADSERPPVTLEGEFKRRDD